MNENVKKILDVEFNMEVIDIFVIDLFEFVGILVV